MKFLTLFIGWQRQLFGFCPNCNSDAPRKSQCLVCLNDDRWPPTKEIKRNRWWLFKMMCKYDRSRFVDDPYLFITQQLFKFDQINKLIKLSK